MTRLAVPADAEAMKRLYDAQYSDFYPNVNRVFSDSDLLATAIQSPVYRFYVATTPEEEIAGAICIRADEHFYGSSEACGLIVDDRYRGKGYFTELSRTMRADFDSLDVDSIYYVSVTKNTKVQESEYRAGATPCGLILDKYKNYVNDGLQEGLQLLVMCRPVKKRVTEKLFIPTEIEAEARALYKEMGVKLGNEHTGRLADSLKAAIPAYDSLEYFGRLPRNFDETKHINLYLNMADENCPEDYLSAKAKGFFFTGFKPLQLEAEYIILHRPPAPSRFLAAITEAKTLEAFEPIRRKIIALARLQEANP
jgi:hypothetical protein